MTEWTVRFITEQDEDEVIGLHRRAFPHARRTVEHQRWKYTANPFGEPIRVGAFADDGMLATHVSSYALPLVRFEGGTLRTLRAQQIGDSMTDPRFRRVGHGKRGLFARAMRRLVDAGGERGMDVVYGVAPARLQRFYVRHIVGSERLIDIPFRVGELRRGKLPAGADTAWVESGAQYSIREWDNQTAELDALFARVAPAFGTLVRRDGAYVKWRYRDSPDHRYLITVAEFDGTVVAWCAFRPDGSDLLWGDALVDPAHVAAVPALLSRVIRQAPKARRLRAWFREEPEWWARVVDSLGLAREAEPLDQSVISACYPPTGSRPALTGDDLRREFYMTMGDSDLF
jgi:hypothetical protein